LYVTSPADLDPREVTRLVADLSPDGTGTLEVTKDDVFPRPLLEQLLFWQLVALVLTLAIEAVVVVLWFVVLGKTAAMPRALLAGLVGNLLTHPVVWNVGVLTKDQLGWDVVLLIFVASEAGAVVVEAALYTWVGRMRFWPALLLSFLANTASVLVGCGIVTFG
jgi:hypothetical protein